MEFSFTTSMTYCIATNQTLSNTILFVGLSQLGSLMPDFDSQNSTIGKYAPIISGFLNRKIGHRTITHDLLLCTVIAIITTSVQPLFLGFWFGYLGHLFIDGFTKQGICFGIFLWYKKPILYAYAKKYSPNKRIKGELHFIPKMFRCYSISKAAIVTERFLATVTSLTITFVIHPSILKNIFSKI